MKTTYSFLRKSTLALFIFVSLGSLSTAITGVNASAAFAGEDKELTERDAVRAAADLGLKVSGAKSLSEDGSEWLVFTADGEQVIISLDDNGVIIEGHDIPL